MNDIAQYTEYKTTVGYNPRDRNNTTATAFTIIQRYQCSMIFLASIHVAIMESDVINESHPGTGESVKLSSTYHIEIYKKRKIIVSIMDVFSFILETTRIAELSIPNPNPSREGSFLCTSPCTCCPEP